MSAKLEVESSESSINIERMSTKSADADHIGSTNQPSLIKRIPSGSGQLQSHFEEAMKKYEQDQARIRSAIPTISPGACIPDVEMELSGSRHSRSNDYNFEVSGPDNPRRPQMATTEMVFGGGVGPEWLRMSTIADLKEFSGRDKDEDQARS